MQGPDEEGSILRSKALAGGLLEKEEEYDNESSTSMCVRKYG